jgi:dihydrofolate reductase
MDPKISLIVAISKNRAIGKDNKLLWYIPEDLKRFRQLTSGHPIIMGRKTFESIGKPLPNRTNIIITRDQNYHQDGAIVVHSLDEALSKAKEIENGEIFIIGGGQIYEQALPLANKLYITVIDTHIEDADTYFPEYPHFTKILREEQSQHDGLKFTWYELEKE